jgi:hypothetical protein
MSFPQLGRVLAAMKFIFIVCLLSGCQGQGPKEEEPEARHLRRAALLCRDYHFTTWKRPAKIDEVKEWAIEEGKATAEDFVSTRDREPYGILFFQMGGQLLVYEQTGENDKHYLFHMGNVSEVTKEGLEGRIAYMNSTIIMRGDLTQKRAEKESSAR